MKRPPGGGRGVVVARMRDRTLVLKRLRVRRWAYGVALPDCSGSASRPCGRGISNDDTFILVQQSAYPNGRGAENRVGDVLRQCRATAGAGDGGSARLFVHHVDRGTTRAGSASGWRHSSADTAVPSRTGRTREECRGRRASTRGPFASRRGMSTRRVTRAGKRISPRSAGTATSCCCRKRRCRPAMRDVAADRRASLGDGELVRLRRLRYRRPHRRPCRARRKLHAARRRASSSPSEIGRHFLVRARGIIADAGRGQCARDQFLAVDRCLSRANDSARRRPCHARRADHFRRRFQHVVRCAAKKPSTMSR